jgi:hypothetical protein
MGSIGQYPGVMDIIENVWIENVTLLNGQVSNAPPPFLGSTSNSIRTVLVSRHGLVPMWAMAVSTTSLTRTSASRTPTALSSWISATLT